VNAAPTGTRRAPHDSSQPRRTTRQTLAKHLASTVPTVCADFGVMIALVRFAHASPVVATVFGALSGAATNFTLGRRWTFRATDVAPAGQAARYAIVSAASLGWNALGEYGFATVLGLQYVVARALVAVAVSLLWNYPLQRYFVFRTAVRSPGAAESA
jgi:putative flippase GtrA